MSGTADALAVVVIVGLAYILGFLHCLGRVMRVQRRHLLDVPPSVHDELWEDVAPWPIRRGAAWSIERDHKRARR